MVFILFLLVSFANADPAKEGSCRQSIETALKAKNKSVEMTPELKVAEGKIRANVEGGMFKSSTTKASKLRLLSDDEVYRASYDSKDREIKAHIDVIADAHGEIKMYRLRSKGKKQYWCRKK